MIKIINRQELMELLVTKDKNAILIDVLPEDHYQQIHIKGAVSLPLGKMDKYANKLFDKSDPIIVYCANRECRASAKAAEKLESLGFDKIYEYAGGLADYIDAGLPLEGHAVVQEKSSCCG